MRKHICDTILTKKKHLYWQTGLWSTPYCQPMATQERGELMLTSHVSSLFQVSSWVHQLVDRSYFGCHRCHVWHGWQSICVNSAKFFISTSTKFEVCSNRWEWLILSVEKACPFFLGNELLGAKRGSLKLSLFKFSLVSLNKQRINNQCFQRWGISPRLSS